MADARPSVPPLLELRGIAKRYGGVRALEEVDFACRPGSIHAVLGENGAGKSTLIKIVSGVVQPDVGEILLGGEPVRFAGPSAANRAGIVAIFQELSLVPDLSVADNVCLSDPPRRFGMIDRRAQRRRAAEYPGPSWLRRPRSRHPRQGPAALAPPAGRDRQGAGAAATAADPGRGDLGPDRRRRRAGVRSCCINCAARIWRCSTSRIACTRSPPWQTPARCSATAVTSRPSCTARGPKRRSSG